MSILKPLLQFSGEPVSEAKWAEICHGAKSLFEQGKLLEHLALLNNCLRQFPDESAPAMMLAHTLHKIDKFEDADLVADLAAKRGADVYEYRLLKTHKAIDRDSPEIARMHLIRAVAKSDVYNLNAQKSLLTLSLKLEAFPAVTIIASRILNAEPGNPDAQKGYLDSAFELEAFDSALERLEAWIDAADANLDLAPYVLNEDFQTAVDPERGRKLKKKVRFRWPDHPSLPARVRWLTPEHGQATTLALAGHVDEALELIGMATPPENENLRQFWDAFVKTLKGLPRDGELQRPLIAQGGKHEIRISPPGPSETVVVFFGGLAAGAGIPTIFLDRYFAAKGWQSVFISDYQRRCFVTGLSSVSDTLEGLCDHLAHLDAVRNAEQVVVISNSAGSIGAIRFAIQVDADRTICFSPVATLNEQHREELGDTRQARMTRQLANIVPAEDLDVQSVLRANRGHVSVDIVHGEKMPADVAHAIMLGRQPGVTRYEVSGYERHEVFSHIISNGKLDAILDGDFSVIPLLPAS